MSFWLQAIRNSLSGREAIDGLAEMIELALELLLTRNSCVATRSESKVRAKISTLGRLTGAPGTSCSSCEETAVRSCSETQATTNPPLVKATTAGVLWL